MEKLWTVVFKWFVDQTIFESERYGTIKQALNHWPNGMIWYMNIYIYDSMVFLVPFFFNIFCWNFARTAVCYVVSWSRHRFGKAHIFRSTMLNINSFRIPKSIFGVFSTKTKVFFSRTQILKPCSGNQWLFRNRLWTSEHQIVWNNYNYKSFRISENQTF